MRPASGLMSLTSLHPSLPDLPDLLTGWQSLSGSDMASRDAATEKQLVLLLSQPLEQYGVVTSLGLDYYAQVLALLRPPTQKVGWQRFWAGSEDQPWPCLRKNFLDICCPDSFSRRRCLAMPAQAYIQLGVAQCTSLWQRLQLCRC